MRFLKEHGEKIATAVVVLCCLGFIVRALRVQPDEEFQNLEKDKAKIQRALSKKQVDPEWAWAEKKRPKFSETLSGHFERPQAPLDRVGSAFSFYPHPRRPFVDPALAVKEDKTRPVVEDFAVLKPPENMLAKADHGRVYVACRAPAALRYLEPVRIELFRGTKPDHVDQAIGVIPIRPEEFTAADQARPEAGAEKKPGAARPGAVDEEPKRAHTARALKNETTEEYEETAESGGEEEAQVPKAFKGLYVYRDVRVAPKQTYYYKARLIARLAKTDAAGLIVRANKRVRVKIPKGLEAVKPQQAGSKVKLFASTFGATVHDTTPPNFLVRFAGMIGKLPDPSKPAKFRRRPNYLGNFAIKIWIPPALEWGETIVQTRVGTELKGTAHYKDRKTKRRKKFPFATGFALQEIKMGVNRIMGKKTVLLTEKKKDPQTGEVRDVPILDPDTNRPLKTQVQYERKIPVKIAVLRDLKTGELDEHPQRADFERRKEAFVYYDRLIKEQAVADQQRKERIKKAVQRIKQRPAGAQQPLQPGGGPGMDRPPAPGP